jgi:hypothetical protein
VSPVDLHRPSGLDSGPSGSRAIRKDHQDVVSGARVDSKVMHGGILAAVAGSGHTVGEASTEKPLCRNEVSGSIRSSVLDVGVMFFYETI